MRRALVTGIAGFIGSTLAEHLIASSPSVEVIGIDQFTDYYPRRVKEGNLTALRAAGVEILEDDLVSADLDKLLDGIDVVFHQAGQPGVRPSWGSTFDAYAHDNILASQRLLEAARRAGGLSRFVYASSSSVYGDAKRYPTVETDTPQPLSPYGVTKLAAEHLMGLYAANFGVPTVSLRYFTVYGPRQRPDMAFTRFITRALTGRAIQLYGTGDQIRDFTFVDDIVRANIAAASAAVPLGSVYNISGGSSVSVNDVIASLEHILGRPIQLQRFDANAGEVFRTGGTSAAAQEFLDWVPTVSLEEGLKRQALWVKGRLKEFIDLV